MALGDVIERRDAKFVVLAPRRPAAQLRGHPRCVGLVPRSPYGSGVTDSRGGKHGIGSPCRASVSGSGRIPHDGRAAAGWTPRRIGRTQGQAAGRALAWSETIHHSPLPHSAAGLLGRPAHLPKACAVARAPRISDDAGHSPGLAPVCAEHGVCRNRRSDASPAPSGRA
jgi:hypothetical protein